MNETEKAEHAEHAEHAELLQDIITMKKMVKIWNYLAQPWHANAAKTEPYVALDLTSDVNDCPCCQKAFVGHLIRAVDCRRCLLIDLWPHKCFGPNGLYTRWLDGRGTPRATTAANEILVASRLKLKELEELQRCSTLQT